MPEFDITIASTRDRDVLRASQRRRRVIPPAAFVATTTHKPTDYTKRALQHYAVMMPKRVKKVTAIVIDDQRVRAANDFAETKSCIGAALSHPRVSPRHDFSQRFFYTLRTTKLATGSRLHVVDLAIASCEKKVGFIWQ